jgi:type IV secretory pathway VirB2 component (pilin)
MTAATIPTTSQPRRIDVRGFVRGMPIGMRDGATFFLALSVASAFPRHGAKAQFGGGGGAGGTSLVAFFNNLANLIISDVGSILCVIGLAIAALVVLFGQGGAGLLGRAVGGIGIFWCCAWIVARLTGGANAFGGI